MEKEIETINKNQEEMKNKIWEIKKTQEGFTSRLDKAENRSASWRKKEKKILRKSKKRKDTQKE